MKDKLQKRERRTLAAGLAGRIGRFGCDDVGMAAVEGALLLPVALAVLGLVVFGGQGLEIKRKVTQASSTVASLVSQATLPSNANNTSAAVMNQSTLDYYLSLAALVLYPNNSSGLTVVLSEIEVGVNGPLTGTVQWSEAWPSTATKRPTNQVINLSSSIVAAGSTYLLLSEVSYTYQPLGVSQTLAPITLSDSIFMAPRSAANVTISWGQ
jgi:Flp pilus assembly protein TadG